MNLFEGAEFSFNTLTVHIRVIYSADLRTIFEGIYIIIFGRMLHRNVIKGNIKMVC